MPRLAPDISEHQGYIDWDALAPNIDGAILRCGFGDDIESQDDKRFKFNADACERLGIPYGVYLYSYATSDTQSYSEAAHALRLIEGRNLSYPVYFDSEESGTEAHALRGAEIFCTEIEKAGYDAGIYASESWWINNLDTSCNWSKWVANWSRKPSFDCDVWQYTDCGYITGYHSRLDLNEIYIEPKGIVEMNEEQIKMLAEEIASRTWAKFNDPYTGCDDNKAIWGPDGKGTGDGKRNGYNTIRWMYDMLDMLNKKLDKIAGSNVFKV